MANPVDQVLSRRARRPARGVEAASLGAAFLLHLLVVAVAFLLPRLQPPPKDLEFVPVQIIPAAALGVRKPAPQRPRPTPPAPEPEKPEPAAAEPPPAPPEPEPESEPEPVRPRPEAPVLPRETDKKPEKKPETPRTTTPRTAPAPETPRRPTPTPPERPSTNPPNDSSRGTTGRPEDSGDQAGRRGAPTGSAVGTTAFGSEIGGVDNPDFKFGYYLDQLLARIDQNWARPSLGDNLEAKIVFRIHKDGTITELEVQESSGFKAFDLAATRAVSNAAPFPPLPRAYRHDSLGVTLIVR